MLLLLLLFYSYLCDAHTSELRHTHLRVVCPLTPPYRVPRVGSIGAENQSHLATLPHEVRLAHLVTCGRHVWVGMYCVYRIDETDEVCLCSV